MNDRLKPRSGFTLLELLMVVIIIGILASIALPQFLKAAERARSAEALNMLAAMRSAELRYAAFDSTSGPGTAFYAGNAQECALDIDIPTCSNGVFVTPLGTPLWSYNADQGAALCRQGSGCHALANRVAGIAPGGGIQINLDTGAVSSTDAGHNAAIWGVNPGPLC